MTTPPATPRKALIKTITSVLIIVALAVGALFVIKAQLVPKNGAGPQAEANAEVGGVLPDFELNGVGQTKSAKISDFHSKVILINFWATWCEACVEEMPSLVLLRNAYKDKGFEIIGVNLDENPEAVVPKSLKELKIDFPVFSDPESKVSSYFDVHAIPLSVVINADRKILYIENGERNWNDQESRKQIENWLVGK